MCSKECFFGHYLIINYYFGARLLCLKLQRQLSCNQNLDKPMILYIYVDVGFRVIQLSGGHSI